MPPCPVPGSTHGPIPEGSGQVGTLLNVINHLAENDRAYLEARCKQVLAELGVDVNLPTEKVDARDAASGGGTQ